MRSAGGGGASRSAVAEADEGGSEPGTSAAIAACRANKQKSDVGERIWEAFTRLKKAKRERVGDAKLGDKHR